MEKEDNNTKKKFPKEKIILFAIGVLVGAVITTGAFLAFVNLSGASINCPVSQSGQSSQMPSGTPPEMPSGEDGENGGTPPELPEGESGENGGTPPEMPSENSQDEEQNQDGQSKAPAMRPKGGAPTQSNS